MLRVISGFFESAVWNYIQSLLYVEQIFFKSIFSPLLPSLFSLLFPGSKKQGGYLKP